MVEVNAITIITAGKLGGDFNFVIWWLKEGLSIKKNVCRDNRARLNSWGCKIVLGQVNDLFTSDYDTMHACKGARVAQLKRCT